jgi:integrase
MRHPSGKLFRNSEGLAWTTDAVNCAFVRIQIRQGQQHMARQGVAFTDADIRKFAATLCKTRKAGGRTVEKSERDLFIEARRKLRYRKACELAPKYCLYAIRHTWMNRMLTGGVDALTVAILAGHCDPSTLAKTYQHLSQNPKFLLSQVRRTAG